MNTKPPAIPAGRRGILAWCLYDWANSAVPTVITTFVFATYFTKVLAADEVSGTARWGDALAVSGLVVAVLAPVLGAIADGTGRRKPWLAAFSLLCCASVAMLWFAAPGPGAATWALACVVIALWGFEFGMVFYNAMLAEIAPETHLGRISGWGWGIGYVGGLACLAVSLVGFVQTESPWFGVGTENYENIRAVALVVAVWFLVFALPLFVFTPDAPATGQTVRGAVRTGLRQLADTFRQLGRYRVIVRFLIARMLYADGLATLFAFGGIYAAGTFDMSFAEVMQFGIALNVTAGLGAVAMAFLDDRIGPKPVIVVSLLALICFGTGVLFVEGKLWFWVLGLALGAFVGPVQAASRSLMARLAPPDMRGEFFGLFALSGKATSFLGPLLLGWVTLAFESQRAGMATIVVFFLAGLLLLLATPVRREK